MMQNCRKKTAKNFDRTIKFIVNKLKEKMISHLNNFFLEFLGVHVNGCVDFNYKCLRIYEHTNDVI